MSVVNLKGVRSLLTLLAAPAVLALAACDEDTVVNVTGDTPVLNVLIGPGDAIVPGGSTALGQIRISGFDFGVPDGFARATGALGNYKGIPCCGSTLFRGFDVRANFRNSSQDPRLPRLVTSTATPGSFWGLFNPWFTGGTGFWDLWGGINGLKPNTDYTIVLARMALRVNGQLDQNQVLTGFPVTNPDELVYLGGTEAGFPAVRCNFSVFTVNVTASTNPFTAGFQTTNDDGNLTGGGAVDCVIRAVGDSPWWRSAANDLPPGAADSVPVGVNAAGTVKPGQFNYVLVFEGRGTAANPVPDGAPVIRIQMGPDIDANGNVINNTFAPFPTTITNTATFKSLPGGANAFAAPGVITLTLTGLPTLGSRQYRVWLHNAANNAFAAANVKVDGGAAVSGFDSPGETGTLKVVLDDDAGVDFGANNSVVISHEAPGATAPGNSKFLFGGYLTQAQALVSGPLTLGTFSQPTPKVFRIAGSGKGSFFADSLIVTLLRLPTPPEGFHYQSFVVALTGPDITASQRLHTITLDEIGNATDRIAESELTGGFEAWNAYVVALEPDGLTLLTKATIQTSENWKDKFKAFFE